MQTTRYGNARLEFRALNRQGETVSYAVKEWRDMLQSITRKDYQAMLTDRASRLLQSRLQGESPTDFMKRIRPRIIAREEEGILLNLMHHSRSHYYCKTLPNWNALAAHISNVEDHLNQSLNT